MSELPLGKGLEFGGAEITDLTSFRSSLEDDPAAPVDDPEIIEISRILDQAAGASKFKPALPGLSPEAARLVAVYTIFGDEL